MKKLLFILAVATIISCSNDEEIEAKDCNCDRVVEVSTFGTIGTIEQPAMRYESVMITINDCTQVQRTKNHSTTNINFVPKIGECR